MGQHATCTAVLLLTCNVVSGLLNKTENNETVKITELFSTSLALCNNKLDLSCPATLFQRDNRIDFCGFSCHVGTSYHCKDDPDHGIIEFCAKAEICEKGWMNNVYFDDQHQRVVVQKQICPDGYYQPNESNCYTACTSTYLRHVNEKFLPQNGVEVLYHGNNTHPGVGYCDISSGFVNVDNKMYFDITQYEISRCDKLDINCPAGQRLLPDSACVPECKEGFSIDRYNFFKCSMKSTRGDISITIKLSTMVPKVYSDSGISLFKHITTQATISTTAQDHSAGYTAAVSIACVLGIAVVFLIVWRLWMLCKKKCTPRQRIQDQVIECKKMTSYEKCKFKNYTTKHGNINFFTGSDVVCKKKLMQTIPTNTDLATYANMNEYYQQRTTSSEFQRNEEQVPEPRMNLLESWTAGLNYDGNNEETEVLKPCIN